MHRFGANGEAVGGAGDGSVFVGTVDLCAGIAQAVEHLDARMPVEVVRSYGNDGDMGMGGGKEGKRGRGVAAVVSHFEHIAGKGLPGGEEIGLFVGFGVSREEEGRAPILQQEDDAGVVGSAVRLRFRRRQNARRDAILKIQRLSPSRRQVANMVLGGIRAQNVRSLRDAGADLIAVISGLWDAPDPAATAREYLTAFVQPDPDHNP